MTNARCALITIGLLAATYGVSVGHEPATQNKVVRPRRVESKLTNPYMGFIYYGGSALPDIADVYYPTFVWSDFEPEEGKYVWNHPKLQERVEIARQRGKRVALRVCPSFQGTDYATPKWVYDLGVSRIKIDKPEEEERSPAYKKFYEPEWWNPIYIEKYCNFIAAFGKEFDGKPWLEYVDMRCYGFWGEGHRHGATEPWPDNVSKRETLIKFIDAHVNAFKKTPQVVQMAGDKDTPYPEGTAIDYALAKGCWMRRDGFGPFINKDEERVMKAHFPTSIMIAENAGSLAYYVSNKIRKRWIPNSKPISMETMYDQILEFHCNYVPLGWGDQCWQVLRWRPELLKKLWMKMGYRFVIQEASFPAQGAVGGKLTVKHTWINEGVGRLPVAHPLVFYLADVLGKVRPVHLDQTFDQTAWFEGEPHSFSHTIEVPGDLKPGEYLLAVALVDPESGEPTIALGIENDDSQRRYILGTIDLLSL
jgi:hypothetical protein